MTTQYGRDPSTPTIRETYEEYDVGGTRLSIIADPENGHAWVQSDHVVALEQ